MIRGILKAVVLGWIAKKFATRGQAGSRTADAQRRRPPADSRA